MPTNISNLSKKQKMYIGTFLVLFISILGEITSVEFVVKLVIVAFSISVVVIVLVVGFKLVQILKHKNGVNFSEL